MAALVAISTKVAERCRPPPLPVTVIGYAPAGALPAMVTVIVAVPDPGAAMLLGLKPTVAHEGTPEAVRAIELLKLPFAAEVKVVLP